MCLLSVCCPPFPGRGGVLRLPRFRAPPSPALGRRPLKTRDEKEGHGLRPLVSTIAWCVVSPCRHELRAEIPGFSCNSSSFLAEKRPEKSMLGRVLMWLVPPR